MENFRKFMLGDYYNDGDGVKEITSISTLGGLVVGALAPFMSHETYFTNDNVIAASQGARKIDNLKPITVTREWLENAGFEKAGMQAVGCEAWYYENRELFDVSICVDFINKSVGVENAKTRAASTYEVSSKSRLLNGLDLYVSDIQHCLRNVGISNEVDSRWGFISTEKPKDEENNG